jgi:hypothetical protein
MADNDKTIIMEPDGKTAPVATSMKVAHAGQINNTTTTETAAITGSPANKCYAPTLYLHTAEDMAKMSATTYNHSSHSTTTAAASFTKKPVPPAKKNDPHQTGPCRGKWHHNLHGRQSHVFIWYVNGMDDD